MIENKKILILGMARSGVSIAKFLAKYNNNIIITDLKEQEESLLKELKDLNIQVEIKEKQEDLVDNTLDYVIKNPAIRKDNISVLKAKKLGIPVINEIEASYKFLPQDIFIITITGSNGKTTTTTLIYELLKQKYQNVHLGGNIGIPLSSIVENIKEKDILVLEISDHQLCDMYEFKSNISILTNLSEVHIDFHDTYENYKNIKKRIFNHHTKNDWSILNKSDKDVLELTKEIESQKMYFSTKEKADIYLKNHKIVLKDEEIVDTKNIKLKGNHNYENIMCAILIAKKFNMENEIIKSFLSTFSGVEHRLEYVEEIHNVKFYNDSKSTNNKSTIIALESFKEPIILIMGGLDRNIPFDEITPHLTNVKYIICYGETKNKIYEWAKDKVECQITNTLQEATEMANQKSEKGDIVLLSPACASWDQFKDFEERGQEFKKIVLNLQLD